AIIVENIFSFVIQEESRSQVIVFSIFFYSSFPRIGSSLHSEAVEGEQEECLMILPELDKDYRIFIIIPVRGVQKFISNDISRICYDQIICHNNIGIHIFLQSFLFNLKDHLWMITIEGGGTSAVLDYLIKNTVYNLKHFKETYWFQRGKKTSAFGRVIQMPVDPEGQMKPSAIMEGNAVPMRLYCLEVFSMSIMVHVQDLYIWIFFEARRRRAEACRQAEVHHQGRGARTV
ncbi:hypothetical protein ACJX0J_009546, partial [Zea mays]